MSNIYGYYRLFRPVQPTGRLEIANHTTDAICGLREPTVVTKLTSFLGLYKVFRRFVPNLAHISTPHNKNMNKGEPSHFDPLTEDELEEMMLQSKLPSPPVLALPRLSDKFTVETDAEDQQVCCLLLKDQADGKTKPVGYWLRSFNNAEKDYSTAHSECLAVPWTVIMVRLYLEVIRFTIGTDPKALRGSLNMEYAMVKLSRWHLRLSELDLDVVNRWFPVLFGDNCPWHIQSGRRHSYLRGQEDSKSNKRRSGRSGRSRGAV